MSAHESTSTLPPRDAVERLVSDLVAIDSVNPDLVAGAAGEAAIAEHVAAWLRAAGLDVELDLAAPGRPSVIATARGTGGGRTLLLNAHLDTVGVAGMEEPHRPRVDSGRLYGRGAYDMKGGLAAVMLAAAGAAGDGLRGDVVVTAVADEEFASLGTQSVLERCTADAAIVTEPSALDVCVAHKGFVWFEIAAQGRAAHGSQPGKGADAIAALGEGLVGISELDRSLAAVEHPLLGRGSVHASLVEGGQELSSYPDRARVQVERRTLPGETAAAIEAEAAALADRVGRAVPGVSASARTLLVRDPFEVSPEEDIVRILAERVGALRGAPPAITGENPWMDAALLTAAGIPTVVFGPGGDGAHALLEWVELDDVALCAAALRETARAFCA